MFKRFSVLFFGVLAVACSDDPSTSTPEPPACQSELASGLAFDDAYAYTGDTYTITGIKFCKDDLKGVVLNDIEVAFQDILETKISFTIPSNITTDSATIKIKTNTGIVDLHKKIAIFPGGGTWREVEAFPGPLRSLSEFCVLNGKGYVSGGEQYIDYSNDTYNFTQHNDLYEFDPTTNVWTLIAEDDNFTEKVTTVGWNNELFLFPRVFGPVTTFGLDNKLFDKTKTYSTSQAINVFGFTAGTDLYSVVTENSTKKIEIRKYDAADKTWDILQSTAFNADFTYLDFAFEHDGLVYLGWNALNSPTIELWTYEASENELTRINTLEMPAANGSLLIRHLFTLKDLAYFIEIGTSSVSPSSATVADISSTLYMYNLKTQAWHKAAHQFPESMFGGVSFTISGRGFAGMGAASGGQSFKYSNRFYEFKAK